MIKQQEHSEKCTTELRVQFISSQFGKLSPIEGWVLLFFTVRAFEKYVETDQSYEGERRFAASFVARSLNLGEATAKRVIKSLQHKKYLEKIESNHNQGNLYRVLKPFVFPKQSFLESVQNGPTRQINMNQLSTEKVTVGSKETNCQIILSQQLVQNDPHHDSDSDLIEIRSDCLGLKEIFRERWQQLGESDQQGEERVFFEILRQHPNDLLLIRDVVNYCEEKKTDLFGKPIKTSVIGMLKNTFNKGKWPILQRTWEQIKTKKCESEAVVYGKPDDRVAAPPPIEQTEQPSAEAWESAETEFLKAFQGETLKAMIKAYADPSCTPGGRLQQLSASKNWDEKGRPMVAEAPEAQQEEKISEEVTTESNTNQDSPKVDPQSIEMTPSVEANLVKQDIPVESNINSPPPSKQNAHGIEPQSLVHNRCGHFAHLIGIKSIPVINKNQQINSPCF